ncbi:MAG TPA: FkbM family methyltransferase [Steroidobacteraceae bacterium]|nr:FkbM family methyltransferase [Steroidobacteraceae bacterium]
MNAGTAPLSLHRYRPRRFPDLVRVGSTFDGGYVLPLGAIRASQALLSLGVEENWEFEQEVLALKPSIRLTCVDGTTGPELIRTKAIREMLKALLRLRAGKFLRMARLLRRPRAFREFFAEHEFLKLMVAGRSGPGAATLEELLDRVRRGDPGCWVLVKIDIEGSEYDALAGRIEGLGRVAALIVEFHALERNWQRFAALLDALAARFVIAHVHGNNYGGYVPGSRVPQTLEVTLIHRDLAPVVPPPTSDRYPLPGLDRPNNHRHPDLELSFE